MKLIIDIPDKVYDMLTEYQVLPENIDLEYFVIHSTPLVEELDEELEKVKAELNDYHLLVDTGERNPEVTFEIGKQLAIKVIEDRLSELKGEQE